MKRKKSKKNEQIVYKVVTANKDKYYSALIGHLPRGKHGRVRYKLGKWVRSWKWLTRKGYHLVAFTRKDDALHFSRAPSHKVFKARGRGITKKSKLPPRCIIRYLDQDGDLIPVHYPWPYSTVMCKEIMLLEEVKR